MGYRHLVILVIFTTTFHLTVQDTNDNKIDRDAFAEAASSFLNKENVQHLGSMVNNLMQSEGGKQLGDMLMNSAGGKNNQAILEGIGSMLNQNSGGFDPSMLNNIFNFFNTDNGQKYDSVDFGGLFSLLGNFLGQSGGSDNFANILPSLVNSLGAFFGPEAEKRASSHSGHAWLVPPILEKIHVLFDHFIHSDLGRQFLETMGAEKVFKMFADKNGRFSFDKLIELLENQSFRRHWIQMVTKRIALAISYVADPKTQKKYLTSIQYFVNSFLKSQGYPKAALFDPLRPTETISAFVNHYFKTVANAQVDSKPYVKPAVEYVKELFRLAQKKGFIMGSGIDSRALTNKLTDTINLEMIEPIARVYRAYRFIKRTPQCDKYVLCLVNQEQQDEQLSLPGLKLLLSRVFSIISSWFLSAKTGTPFWTLYETIVDDKNCQAKFVDACNDFHIEEIKVTTEYIHNEL